MSKISTLYELNWFIGSILEENSNFLYPVKDMDDNLDILKVYNKAIELASNHFGVEIALIEIPFFMKFNLASFVVNKVRGKNGTDELYKKIYSLPFDSDSELLTAIKNDYRVCTTLSNIGCFNNKYELPYLLLNHVYENVHNIRSADYTIIEYELAYLIDFLNTKVQEILYNDASNLLNHEVSAFALSYTKVSATKKEDTLVYKRLLAEYPDILKVYEKTTETLESILAKDSLLN